MLTNRASRPRLYVQGEALGRRLSHRLQVDHIPGLVFGSGRELKPDSLQVTDVVAISGQAPCLGAVQVGEEARVSRVQELAQLDVLVFRYDEVELDL